MEHKNGQSVFEVIYISPSCKQSVSFILEFVEKLKKNRISNFEVDMEHLQIKSDKFIICAVDIFRGNLWISYYDVKYYIDKVTKSDYPRKRVRENALEKMKFLRCCFRKDTKEISEDELIDILMEESV